MVTAGLKNLHFGNRFRERASIPWVYWLLLFGVALTATAVVLVEVDVTVRFPVIGRPRLDQLPVRASARGNIVHLQFKDNQEVQLNDVLFMVDSQAIDQEISHFTLQLQKNRNYKNDYTKLLEFWNHALELHKRGSLVHVAAEATQVLEAQSNNQIVTPAIAAEAHQLISELQNNDIAIEQALRDFTRNKKLADLGLVTASELEQSQNVYLRAKMGNTITMQKYLLHWAGRVDQITTQIEENEKAIAERLTEKEKHSIRSPARGELIGFSNIAIGTYVDVGQAVGNVSPSDELVFEGYVTARDIGLLRIDQEVKVQVDAFPYTEWGHAKCSIQEIASDAIRRGDEPEFRILLRVESTSLNSARAPKAEIQKGMKGLARVIVVRRRLWNLLLDRTSDWFDPYRSAPRSIIQSGKS